MPTMAENWASVRPGDPAFYVGTNIADMFELGHQTSSGHWLDARIVGDGEFLFNGRLFLPSPEQGGMPGTVIDNFPKGPTPHGWTKYPRVDEEGYDLKSGNKTLFGYRVVLWRAPGARAESRLCLVTVNIYDSGGNIVAESLPDQFLVHKGPAQIGTHGIFLR